METNQEGICQKLKRNAAITAGAACFCKVARIENYTEISSKVSNSAKEAPMTQKAKITIVAFWISFGFIAASILAFIALNV